MENKIYVGNLNYKTKEEALKELFEQAGTVLSVKIVTDSMGRSRGFGFIEMSSEDEVGRAIEAFNGTELDSRTLVVNKARPRLNRTERPRGTSRPYRHGRHDEPTPRWH